jgi:glycosyltransferase involved in cell wall biosynthesis
VLVKSGTTFVVIAFNEAEGILDCLKSIIDQEANCDTFITLIDDGSTDGTAELVEKTFSEQVRVLRQANLGRGAARLVGIESTDTEFLAMVDADIILPSNWLSSCLNKIGDKHGVGGIAVPDGDCSTMTRIFNMEPRVKPGSITLMGSNSFFRTEVLKEIGTSWVTRLGEDFRLQRLLENSGFRTSSIAGLIVQHKENKTFFETMKWFFKSGKDASKLWFEFKISRLPDLTFFAFLCLLVVFPFEYHALGVKSLIGLPLFLLLVGIFHLNTKFILLHDPLKFLAAWIPNTVLMTSYLIGRVAGLLSWKTI